VCLLVQNGLRTLLGGGALGGGGRRQVLLPRAPHTLGTPLLDDQAVSKISDTFEPNDVQFIRSIVELDAIQIIVQKCHVQFVRSFKNKPLCLSFL
jgi:hypothetical protein